MFAWIKRKCNHSDFINSFPTPSTPNLPFSHSLPLSHHFPTTDSGNMCIYERMYDSMCGNIRIYMCVYVSMCVYV